MIRNKSMPWSFIRMLCTNSVCRKTYMGLTGFPCQMLLSLELRGVASKLFTADRPKCTTMAWNTDLSRAHSVWTGLFLYRESARTFHILGI